MAFWVITAILPAFVAEVVLGRALPDAPEIRQFAAAADQATPTPRPTPTS